LDPSVLIVILPIKPKANNATNQLGVGTQGKNMYPTGANGGNTYSLWHGMHARAGKHAAR